MRSTLMARERGYGELRHSWGAPHTTALTAMDTARAIASFPTDQLLARKVKEVNKVVAGRYSAGVLAGRRTG